MPGGFGVHGQVNDPASCWHFETARFPELNNFGPARGAEACISRLRRDVLMLRMWAVAVGSEKGSYGSAWFCG